ncbi:male-specific sperm protein Mst84Dd isoform X1 [Drosophila elegans]|uniref:male-specific sperm protein Mst84Dd isoform X1 n=2 Tax=Drosophila elegans TaxID=30023 RepID=UPI0007E879B9|nr:male-specific sperm protein Mst84Dd isoform X1 [Drosophila elegans]
MKQISFHFSSSPKASKFVVRGKFFFLLIPAYVLIMGCAPGGPCCGSCGPCCGPCGPCCGPCGPCCGPCGPCGPCCGPCGPCGPCCGPMEKRNGLQRCCPF